MNISFASAFQSVQAMPQTQAAGVGAHQPKTMSSAGNIKDEYVPSKSDFAGTYKPASPLQDSFQNSEKHKAYNKTLTSKVRAVWLQTVGDVSKSLGLGDKSASPSYNAKLDIVTGNVGGFVWNNNELDYELSPLSPEQATAFRNAYKTTKVEGKSIAEWLATPTQVKDGFEYYEGDPALGKFVSFGRKDSAAQPSFFASLFEMQKASSPMEELMNNPVREMMEELDRLLEEAELRRRAKASDDSPTDGETLSATLDGEEELEIDTEGSDIGGMSKDEILQLITKLFENMNTTEAGGEETVGNALLAMLAKDIGFDLASVKEDPNFSISFSVKRNAETGKSEIFGARVADEFANAHLPSLSNKSGGITDESQK